MIDFPPDNGAVTHSWVVNPDRFTHTVIRRPEDTQFRVRIHVM